MKKYQVLGISVIFASCLGGCGTTYQPMPGHPDYSPVQPERIQPPKSTMGSIYQSDYSLTLYEDDKARRIGDIITVTLVERTTASKLAETKTTKNNTTDVTNPTILGTTPQFNASSLLPLASNRHNNAAFDLRSDRQFDGKGESTQNNQLDGNITVTVSEILPNGNLAIRGEKWITINRGEEFIRLTGIVRPRDVTPDNTVSSTRIANARISYSGTGEVASTNAVGWLAKFFNSSKWAY